MNTMLRSSNAPTQSALAPSSLNNGGRPVGGGVHKGVWIGGSLMALTIIALATALVLKSNGSGSETVAPLAATPPATETAAVPPAGSTTVAQTPAAQVPPPAAAPAPAPVAAPVRTTHHATSHSTGSTTSHSSGSNTNVADNGSYSSNAGNGSYSGSTTPSYSAPPAPPPVCTTCGTVEGYDPVQVQGSTNGIGAVAGGVGGAVLGSKIAGRNNHTLGAAIGAIGGGLLGNQIEKTQRVSTVYDVHVRMEDGSVRTIRQSSVPVVGQKVTVEGSSMHSRSSSSSNTGGSYSNSGSNYQSQSSGNGSSSFSPSGN